MDYEFTNDFVGDQVVRCSMGHEALGHWLTVEIGTNAVLLEKLQTAILRLQQRKAWDFHLEGAQYAIELTREEAIVRAHSLFADDGTDDSAEELDFYDAESLAHCGLEDFAALLQAWCEFIGLPPVIVLPTPS
ncbi:MAG: hypothetical protein ACI9W6_002281 [Motiliproteus sp.]|jgi:uncharacterized protein YacL (UPF0231 family)